jgi:hypothetical protein
LPRPAPRPLCRADASRQRTLCTVALRPEAKIDYDTTGITLLPSRPHVARQAQQTLTFG